VKQRTAAKNSIRAVLNRRLIEHPYGPTLFSEKSRAWMADLELPVTERFIIATRGSQLERLNGDR
jgi:hypothetical protein